mmetsp:Transcript_24201/g.71069  ORF Transcript_24201/g.71069 Transcript_24201/m.71069 type:complete len:370 (-) Transcript_24201:249-1358(-)
MAQTFKVSDEEMAMDGAPKGDLYVVNVLPRDQVGPCEAPEAVLADCLEKASTGALNEWFQQYEFVQALRQLAIHHSGLLTLDVLGQVLAPACRYGASSRSVLAHNSLDCIWEIVVFAGPAAAATGELAPIAQLLMDSSKKLKPKIIKNAAGNALTEIAALGGKDPEHAAVVVTFVELLLQAKFVTGPEVFVAAAAVCFVENAVKEIVGNLGAAGGLQSILGNLVAGLALGLSCKSADAKASAKRVVILLQAQPAETLGAPFEDLVKSCEVKGELTARQATDLLNCGKKPVKQKTVVPKPNLKHLKAKHKSVAVQKRASLEPHLRPEPGVPTHRIVAEIQADETFSSPAKLGEGGNGGAAEDPEEASAAT